MNFRQLLGLSWQCGRCNIITTGKSFGDIKTENKWKPMCYSCSNEMIEIARVIYPQYQW